MSNDIMEENVRKSVKQHLTKSEQLQQTLEQYLQRRNYPPLMFKESTQEEFLLQNQIESACSRSNSILYSCINNDPIGINLMFTKFTNWLNKLTQEYGNLQILLAPLFCHIYLEILRGGHSDTAHNFYKQHINNVKELKCDNDIKELIDLIGCDETNSIYSKIEHFRSHRYLVRLPIKPLDLLKSFLHKCEHIILLQVFQHWFTFEEDEPIEKTQNDQVICNGHTETNRENLKSLLDSIKSVKKEPYTLSEFHLENVRDEVTCGRLNQQNGLAAYAYNNTVWLRPLRTLEQIGHAHEFGEIPLRGHSGRVYDIDFIDSHLISASQDCTICLYDLKHFNKKFVYKGHEYPVFCVAVSPINSIFASGGYDRTVQIFSIETGSRLRWCAGHSQQITCVQFHPNSAYVIAGSTDKTIRMFSVQDGEPVRLLIGSKGAVYSVCYSPSGRYLLSGGDDHKLRLWDLNTAKEIANVNNGFESITKIAISQNEKILITGTSEGIIRMWDFKSIRDQTNDNLMPIKVFNLQNRLCSLNFQLDGFACLTSEHFSNFQLST